MRFRSSPGEHGEAAQHQVRDRARARHEVALERRRGAARQEQHGPAAECLRCLGHRTIEWDGTQPVGVYKCPLIVDDGVTTPVKFVETIKVVALDTNPDNKNKAPKGLKPKTVLALVDHEVRIPVFGIDLDGDPLTFSVNPEKEPYKTKGATFDTKTNEFVWTPTFEDIGVIHPKIQVTDGTKIVTITLTVKVVNSLVFETEEPPPP